MPALALFKGKLVRAVFLTLLAFASLVTPSFAESGAVLVGIDPTRPSGGLNDPMIARFIAAMKGTLAGDAAMTGVIQAPYLSQFDGSIYAESNCGPTAVAMALGGLNINA